MAPPRKPNHAAAEKVKPAASAASESAQVSGEESHAETHADPVPMSAPVTSAATLEPDPSVAPIAEPKTEAVPVATPPATWKDGTYMGWGYSRHGNIEASVVIENGRIAGETISQCRTRYSFSVIERLPP